MQLRAALYTVLAIALSGCSLWDKCTYEIRGVEAGGTMSDNGSQVATAQINLSEQRGSLQGQSMYWLVTGSGVKGHVTSASFKDVSDPSHVLLDLGVASADRSEISQGATGSASGANLGGFHSIIVAGRGLIELQTDLPDRPSIQIPLAVTSSTDWTRPNCS
jgi:hypothetical protein